MQRQTTTAWRQKIEGDDDEDDDELFLWYG